MIGGDVVGTGKNIADQIEIASSKSRAILNMIHHGSLGGLFICIGVTLAAAVQMQI
jgi:hypothetical protein